MTVAERQADQRKTARAAHRLGLPSPRSNSWSVTNAREASACMGRCYALRASSYRHLIVLDGCTAHSGDVPS